MSNLHITQLASEVAEDCIVYFDNPSLFSPNNVPFRMGCHVTEPVLPIHPSKRLRFLQNVARDVVAIMKERRDGEWPRFVLSLEAAEGESASCRLSSLSIDIFHPELEGLNRVENGNAVQETAYFGSDKTNGEMGFDEFVVVTAKKGTHLYIASPASHRRGCAES